VGEDFAAAEANPVERGGREQVPAACQQKHPKLTYVAFQLSFWAKKLEHPDSLTSCGNCAT
jgi:hypothetical protein